MRRYIAMLQDMGIPVETVRGPGGGYRLRPGFKLPPLMLTNDEALAITFSLIATRRQNTHADPHALEGAIAKIERVLPEGLRLQVQAMQSAVNYLQPTPGSRPPSEQVLLFAQAVYQTRTVWMRYASGKQETTRTLNPYGVVPHWNFWYVVGWCHLRQSVRVFRLDRVVEARLENVIFQVPSDFDSLQYVLDSLSRASVGYAFAIRLETTLEDAQQFIPPGTAKLEAVAGGVLMTSRVERLEWLARLIIGWERPFVILHPPELRDALRAVGEQVIAMTTRQ